MRYEGPFRRLAGVFDRSWRIGRLFGVEIRLHVMTLLLPALSLWSLGGSTFESGFVAAYVFGSIAALYLVILVHEFGHIFVARRFQVRSRAITLSPLGGLAHLESPAPHPRAEIAIALAGPATNALWYGLAKAVVPALGPTGLTWFAVESFATLNLYLLLFNLLPFFPLDGGRTFRAALALKLHPNRASLVAANVGVAGGVGLIVYGFVQPGMEGFLVVLIGLRCLQVCLRERMAAKYEESPYAPARDPWSFDSDAWKEGRPIDGGEPEETSRRPGLVARVRRDLAGRAEKKASERRVELQREIDALLEQVAAKGLAGITDAQRAALKRASEELSRLRNS